MKPRSKRQLCMEHHVPAPYGEHALLPAMPRPPRQGHAWDGGGREVRLVRSGRHRLQRRADVLVEEKASDRLILTGEEHGDEDENTTLR